MTVDVVTVTPQTEVKEVARLFLERRISGAPVVEGNQVVGMLSEADLLPVREGAMRRSMRTASTRMHTPVIALAEDDTVTEAARILERNHVKRAPVLRDERLVGIVTRSDLLRPYLRTDPEILAEVEELVLRDGLGISPRRIRPEVRVGVVTLRGEVVDQRERAILLRVVRMVDGVIDVVDALEERPTVGA